MPASGHPGAYPCSHARGYSDSHADSETYGNPQPQTESAPGGGGVTRNQGGDRKERRQDHRSRPRQHGQPQGRSLLRGLQLLLLPRGGVGKARSPLRVVSRLGRKADMDFGRRGPDSTACGFLWTLLSLQKARGPHGAREIVGSPHGPDRRGQHEPRGHRWLCCRP
jgi:hypothetical protein